MEKEFTKEEAIDNAEKFLTELKSLEEKYSMQVGSDTGDIYLTYKKADEQIDTINIGWVGDGTGLKVMEDATQLRKATVNEVIGTIPIEHRFRYCQSQFCGCMGCVNTYRSFIDAGITYNEWQAWFKENQELYEEYLSIKNTINSLTNI